MGQQVGRQQKNQQKTNDIETAFRCGLFYIRSLYKTKTAENKVTLFSTVFVEKLNFKLLILIGLQIDNSFFNE